MTGPEPRDIMDELEAKLEEFLEQVGDDIEPFIDDVGEKARTWIAAFAAGDLSIDEFKELVAGERALLEMLVLQQKVNTKMLVNVIKRFVLETLEDVVTSFVEEKAG